LEYSKAHRLKGQRAYFNGVNCFADSATQTIPNILKIQPIGRDFSPATKNTNLSTNLDFSVVLCG